MFTRFVPLAIAGLVALASNTAFAQEQVIVIKDHVFQPAELTVPANQKIKLIVKNQDSTPEEFESLELRVEKVIKGGKEAVLYVGPLKPGAYPFYGEFNPKTAQGRVIVK